MPAVIPFIPLIAAGIAGGVEVGTSIASDRADERRATGQLDAANRAAELESSNFDKSIAAARDERDYNRWLTAETARARQPYLDQLASALGGGFGSYAPQTYEPGTYEAAKPFKAPDPNELKNDPGYQFELQQGLEEVERSGVSRGTFLTGETGKELQIFGQGLAATRNEERRQRALGEYSLAESLRASAFDRNEANRFNAAQLNQRGASEAASLSNQAVGQRLSALGTLAGLAGPTGTYSGTGSNGGYRNEGGYGTLPITPRDPGDFTGPPVSGPPSVGTMFGGRKPLIESEDQNPWSSALRRIS